jgi:hypothetical protein
MKLFQCLECRKCSVQIDIHKETNAKLAEENMACGVLQMFNSSNYLLKLVEIKDLIMTEHIDIIEPEVFIQDDTVLIKGLKT